MISLSVVSHNQIELVGLLLADLHSKSVAELQVIVTLNTSDERLDFEERDFRFDVMVIANEQPKGFGANHNAAFRHATGEYFCVINPDIRLGQDPFPALADALASDGVGVVGPRIVNPHGQVEDSGRMFPTPARLLVKLWRRLLMRAAPEPDYLIGDARICPDWIGGMLMLFKSPTFRRIGGFDERYFLYYEDVDLCWRLRRLGMNVVLDPAAEVEHGARRSSWSHPRYMRWHLSSMVRFLVTRARS